METTAVRASARQRMHLVAAATLLLAAVAGLRTLDADPAAAQDPDVEWDDSWAEENYDTFIDETGADPGDIPSEPNRESTPGDWEDSVVAMGDQPGWNQEAALTAIGTLPPGFAVSREEAAQIMCAGIGCSSDDTEGQITELAEAGITTGRDGSCVDDPNSQACIDGFDAGSTSTNAQTITFLSRAIDRSRTIYPPSGNIAGGPVQNLTISCGALQTIPVRYLVSVWWTAPAGGAAGYEVMITGNSFWQQPNTNAGRGFATAYDTRQTVWVTVRTLARGTNNQGLYLYVNGSASAGPACRIPRDVSVVGPVSAQEGSPLVFTLELDQTTSSDVTAYVSTREDTRPGARPATPGDDYTPHLATTTVADRTLVVIPAGDLQATVAVDTVDDSEDEYYETLILRIERVYGTGNPIIGDTREAVGTIIDDDNALPEIFMDDGSGDEAGMVRFNARLSAPSGKVVAASVMTAESTPPSASEAQVCGVDDASTDYLDSGKRIIFDPGETTKEFTVQACDDTAEEGHETFDVTLSNPANAVLGTMSVEGVIRDDDIPVLSISGPSGSVDEDTSGVADTAAFTVALDRVGLQTITVTASTISGTASGNPCVLGGDFVYRTRTVTFAPGDLTKSFDVTTCADTVPENDEHFSVVLSSQSSNAVLGIATATATIRDNDEPTVSITSPAASVDEDTGGLANTLTFTVDLDVAHVKYVVVEVSTSSGTATGGTCGSPGVDYVDQTVYVVFSPGETSKDFVVSTCPDTLTGEGTEDFTVTLGYVGSAVLGTATATGEIDDNDEPTVSIAGPSGSVEEDTGGVANTATFTISLDMAGLQPISVVASTTSGTAMAATCVSGGDLVPRTRTVTFNPGDLVKSFDVTTCADTVPENDETFNVVLTNPSNVALGTASAIATIRDSDEPTVSISDPISAVDEDTNGVANSVDFIVSLNVAGVDAATVSVSTSSGTARGGGGVRASRGRLRQPNDDPDLRSG